MPPNRRAERNLSRPRPQRVLGRCGRPSAAFSRTVMHSAALSAPALGLPTPLTDGERAHSRIRSSFRRRKSTDDGLRCAAVLRNGRSRRQGLCGHWPAAVVSQDKAMLRLRAKSATPRPNPSSMRSSACYGSSVSADAFGTCSRHEQGRAVACRRGHRPPTLSEERRRVAARIEGASRPLPSIGPRLGDRADAKSEARTGESWKRKLLAQDKESTVRLAQLAASARRIPQYARSTVLCLRPTLDGRRPHQPRNAPSDSLVVVMPCVGRFASAVTS